MDYKLKEALLSFNTDINGALERFVNNEALYQSFILKFTKDPNFSHLKENLGLGNYKEAFHAAHTLKGIVGNLGFTTLWERIDPLVAALRKQDSSNLTSLFQAFEQEYIKVVTVIQDYEASTNNPVP